MRSEPKKNGRHCSNCVRTGSRQGGFCVSTVLGHSWIDFRNRVQNDDNQIPYDNTDRFTGRTNDLLIIDATLHGGDLPF